jgi:hypothetical protein
MDGSLLRVISARPPPRAGTIISLHRVNAWGDGVDATKSAQQGTSRREGVPANPTINAA